MTELLTALISLIEHLITIALSIGIFIHSFLKAERLEREAIQNGLAYYDTKTRKFTWHEFPPCDECEECI